MSGTNRAREAAYDFSNLSGCEQLVDVATHYCGNYLDLLLTGVPGVVDHCVKPPVGSSDHCSYLLISNWILGFLILGSLVEFI